MNMSEVINDIKLANGLNTIALPFNKPTEVVIKEVLQTSIRTFSRYKPNVKEGFEPRKSLKSPDEQAEKSGIYILPPHYTTTPVQYADAYMASDKYKYGEVTSNAFTVGSPFIGFGSYYPQDILNAVNTGVAINKYAGVTSTQPSSKWLGFNKIQLFDFPKDCYIHFVVKCNHDSNGETIPESCVESFMQLATLDVQIMLYNNLKNMNNVGSAFKEIQLKIDDWANAAADRKALLEKWDGTFHYDNLDLVQFF